MESLFRSTSGAAGAGGAIGEHQRLQAIHDFLMMPENDQIEQAGRLAELLCQTEDEYKK